jgi:hypothetical protein
MSQTPDVIARRIKQMRKGSRRNYGSAPSAEEFAVLVKAIQDDKMRCPVCRRTMNWLLSEGTATVVTIQHDRSGRVRLLCKGCNSRHAQHPGDSYYAVPADHKRCPACEKVKPRCDFYFVKSIGKLSSACIPCTRKIALANYHKDPEPKRERNREWKKANPERLREQRKRYREQQKKGRVS